MAMTKLLQHRRLISRMSPLANRTLAMTIFIILVPGFLATLSARAQTYTVLYSFTGGADGGSPYGGVILDTHGSLYGTTTGGGAHEDGTIFEVDASGHETVLHSFNREEGALPLGGLTRDPAGNLYGTNSRGGGGGCDGKGCGTVFKLRSNGRLPLLQVPGGRFPLAGLVRDSLGNLYGTTSSGGRYSSGAGTIFKVDRALTSVTVLYLFGGFETGKYPAATLIRDKAGNLYGTTSAGGLYHGGCAFGCGTVFKLDPAGTYTVLHTFTAEPDGNTPLAGLVRDAAGNLYGTTAAGGASGQGTVFKLSKTGKETVLYSFTGGTDGGYPHAGLVRDAAGQLYSTTEGGGAAGYGTVFKLDTNGVETVLHSFNGDDGRDPTSSLVQDAAGNLYGTTFLGGSGDCGSAGCGVVFKITP
jgi:uncharacterized repeat protein (TIGR03803 family)